MAKKNMFDIFRERWHGQVDQSVFSKYSPAEIFKGSRTVEELYESRKILQSMDEAKGVTGGQSWWNLYNSRRIELAKQASFIAPGKWALPQSPQEYIEPWKSYGGIKDKRVGRNLFGKYVSFEQAQGKAPLPKVLSPKTPSGFPKVNNLLVWDLETTGLLNEDSRILQLGMSSKDGTSSILAPLDTSRKYSGYIKNAQIPKYQEALKAAGGKTIEEKDLVQRFIKEITPDRTLAGYRSDKFDVPMMAEAAERHGLVKQYKSALGKAKTLDVADYAQEFLRKELSGKFAGWEGAAAKSELGLSALGFKLGPVAEGLGWKGGLGGSHHADVDVAMTRFVADKLQDPVRASKEFNWKAYLPAVERESGHRLVPTAEAKPAFLGEAFKSEKYFSRPFQEHLGEMYGKGARAEAKAVPKGINKFLTKKTALIAAGAAAVTMMLASTGDSAPDMEGMHHGGWAQQVRRGMTDFGSGYRGPNPQLQAEWHKRKEVPKYTRFAPSKLGGSEREIYKYLTEEAPEYEMLAAAAMAGVAAHSYYETKQYAEGKVKDVERLVVDPENQLAGFIDVIYGGGAPGDIKTVSAKRLEHVRKRGAFQKHKSQLNFYMHALGQKKGYLEYISRDDDSEREMVEVPFDKARFEKDLAKLKRVKAQVEADLESGKLRPQDIQYGASVETMRRESKKERAQLEQDIYNIPALKRTYEEELEYYREVQAKRRFPRRNKPYRQWDGIHPGSEGMGAQSIRAHSEFGTGYTRRLIKLFRGTGERISAHYAQRQRLHGEGASSAVKAIEEIFEGVRARDFPHRPSRLTSSFWTPDPKLAKSVAESPLARMATKGSPTVSQVTQPIEDVFIAKSFLFTKAMADPSSAEVLARKYWRGFPAKRVGKAGSKGLDLEALIPAAGKEQAIQAERMWGLKKMARLEKVPGEPWRMKKVEFDRWDGIHPGSEGMGAQSIRTHSDFGSGKVISKILNRAASLFKRKPVITEEMAVLQKMGHGGYQGALAKTVDPEEVVTLYHGTNEFFAKSLVGQSKRVTREQRQALGYFTERPEFLQFHRQNKAAAVKRYASGQRLGRIIDEEGAAQFTSEQTKQLRTNALIETKIKAKYVGLQRVADEHFVPNEFMQFGEHTIHTNLRSNRSVIKLNKAPNAFQGLHPGSEGIGTQSIRTHTEFGSGFDPLRKIALEVFGDNRVLQRVGRKLIPGMRKKAEDVAFKQLTESSQFKSALGEALKTKGTEIGETIKVPIPGQSGLMTLPGKGGRMSKLKMYEANMEIGGRKVPFKFVSKEARLSEKLSQEDILTWEKVQAEGFAAETKALKELGHLQAPSLYGTGQEFGMENTIFMEGFEEAKTISKALSRRQRLSLTSFMKKAHKKGLTHTDLHGGNVLTVKGRGGREEAVIIDWGMANRFEKSAGIGEQHINTANEVAGMVREIGRKKLGKPVSLHEYSQMTDLAQIQRHGKSREVLSTAASKESYLSAKHGINALTRYYGGRISKTAVEDIVGNVMLLSKGRKDSLAEVVVPQIVKEGTVNPAARRASKIRAFKAESRAIELAKQNVRRAKEQAGTMLESPGYTPRPLKEAEARGLKLERKRLDRRRKAAGERNNQFYRVSQQSVGIGIRKAKQANEGHLGFASTMLE